MRLRVRAPQPRAIVSLTFDDGLSSQRRAAALLDERGLLGTFYVPSGMIGSISNRLGWEDVRALAAAGHEIGGHTRTHVHLSEVSPEDAADQIAADRQELLGRGLEVSTFAYPFGEHDERVRALVRDAGYTAARAVGGVLESVPPADVFALRTPHSARSWTDADDLAALVRVAEHEGAWALPVFHHIGEGAETDYATSEADFAAFLDWLLTRNVTVRRVSDVVSTPHARSRSRWRRGAPTS